ncbi:hypothetical protein [Xanthobacter autotrophicus]|uniref:hypothetical protein n=1 Tax=Xanthobacter autotrophicus TaxID=280 RepID=UPI003726BA0E
MGQLNVSVLLVALLAVFSSAALTAAPAGEATSEASRPTDSSEDSATDLAKKLQNPIGDLYSFPFQSNTNFGVGPHKGTQEILNIQPVIPL